MEQPQLSEEQEQSLQQKKDAGLALMGIINTDGWKVVMAYYEAQVKAFASQVLVGSEKIEFFENPRQEIKGMRKLLGYVDECTKALKNEANTATE